MVRLERIKRLRAHGHTLFEIGRILSGPAAAEVRNGTDDGMVAACDFRRRHRVDESGAGPCRTKQLRVAVEGFARRVKPGKKAKG